MSRNFMELLHAKFGEGKFVCVGLDSDITKMPRFGDQFDFNRAIVDATADIVCAYKPNSAFYEARGVKGIENLIDTIRYIKGAYPDVPVILDDHRNRPKGDRQWMNSTSCHN